MPDHRITTTPARNESVPRPPRIRTWSAQETATTVGFAVVGGFLGGLVGWPASQKTFWLVAVVVILGAGAGAVAGAAVAVRSFHRRLGRGIRVNNRALPEESPSRSFPPRPPDRHHTGILVRPAGVTLSPFLRPQRVSRLCGQHGPITALAISSDGRLALSAGKDRTISLWDVQTGFEIRSFTGFVPQLSALAFSPDGRLLVSAGPGLESWSSKPTMVQGGVQVWDTESGQELRRIEFQGSPWSLAFLPDGRQLAIGDLDHVRIWELEGPSPVALIPASDGVFTNEEVRAVAVSADGRQALIGCRTGQEMRLLDLEEGKVLRHFRGHRSRFPLARVSAVVSVAYSPDGERGVSGSWDQTARVWDLRTGREETCFRGHQGWWGWCGVVGVAWVDKDRVISVSEQGLVCVWNATTGEELERHHHGGGVACLATTPDGRLALTGGSDGGVQIWELG